MRWRDVFRHDDERGRKDVELAELEQRAEATVKRADRAVREQQALTEAIRNTVRALRAEHRR